MPELTGDLKVTVIGGGSTYTPEIIDGFLTRINSLPVTDLWLMDNNPERLEIVGGFAQRMVKARGSPFRVHLTTDRRKAIEDAQYVITQLRVGGMKARREDEYLGKRHGLIGQETTGVGGMAKALRTIPVILSIAKDIQELSPEALLVNFSNPSGINTEALSIYAPDVNSLGLCNVPITAKMNILKSLGKDVLHERATLITLGLNHLSWNLGMTIDGKDIWPQVIENYTPNEESPFPVEMVKSINAIPNAYLKYYYQTEKMLAKQDHWPPSRAEEVMTIEADLMKQYSDPKNSMTPEDLMKRGGAYYSTVATQLINSHYNDLGEIHTVNISHNGAVAEYPREWVLEMPCKVNSHGFTPLPFESLPLIYRGLLTQVKSYELLTIEAAVNGDRDSAYQALLAHPLGPSADDAETVLEDMLNVSRNHLPQFARAR